MNIETGRIREVTESSERRIAITGLIRRQLESTANLPQRGTLHYSLPATAEGAAECDGPPQTMQLANFCRMTDVLLAVEPCRHDRRDRAVSTERQRPEELAHLQGSPYACALPEAGDGASSVVLAQIQTLGPFRSQPAVGVEFPATDHFSGGALLVLIDLLLAKGEQVIGQVVVPI